MDVQLYKPGGYREEGEGSDSLSGLFPILKEAVGI